MTDEAPTNGTRYRLENLERTMRDVKTSQDSVVGRVDRMDTFLTGAGIKGSDGKLGEIAETLSAISRQFKATNDNIEQVVREVVEKEMRAARLRVLTLSGKGFYATLTLLIMIAGLVITLLLRHQGG